MIQKVRNALAQVDGDLAEFSKIIYSLFVPTEQEKRKHAEVGTPHALRNEMLDQVPASVWANPESRILEPCCGNTLDILARITRAMKSQYLYTFKNTQ